LTSERTNTKKAQITSIPENSMMSIIGLPRSRQEKNMQQQMRQSELILNPFLSPVNAGIDAKSVPS
jgi:hypothetical protein